MSALISAVLDNQLAVVAAFVIVPMVFVAPIIAYAARRAKKHGNPAELEHEYLQHRQSRPIRS